MTGRTVAVSSLARVIAGRIPAAPDTVRPGRAQLADVAAAIAEQFRPERIVLFGSRAAGVSTDESDVDLMVVMETSLRPAEQAARIRQALDLQPPFAVDVLVRTPEQVVVGLRDGDFFIEDVISLGAVLYEATDARLGR